MINFSDLSDSSFLGKFLRTLLRSMPQGMVMPILQGKLRGKKWIIGAGSNNGYWLGSYEYKMQQTFYESIERGSVVYDIGANVGFYTLLASELVGNKGMVYAFEPIPHNILFLRKHINLNRCSNVTVIEAAVSNQNGTSYVEKALSDGEWFLSSSGTLKVNTVTLDSLVLEKKFVVPQYIKIDIEGGEYLALSGSRFILSHFHPKIFLSVHGEALYKECCDFLKEFGYTLAPIHKIPELAYAHEILAF